MKRPIVPVSITGLDLQPIPTESPVFEWRDPATLLVDDAYQRHPSSRTQRLIRRMLQSWDWRKFRPPVCAETDDGLEVIDGQHTAIAAAAHPDIITIPVMLVEARELTERAGAFVGLNRDRVNITAMQLHIASAAMGDETALTVAQVCKRAGVDLLKVQPSDGVWLPGQTVAVTAIASLINRRHAAGARKVLAVLVEGRAAPISAGLIKAVESLLYDPEFAAGVTPERLAAAMQGKVGAILEEGAGIAAKAHTRAWRGVAVALFRRASRG